MYRSRRRHAHNLRGHTIGFSFVCIRRVVDCQLCLHPNRGRWEHRYPREIVTRESMIRGRNDRALRGLPSR
jgi:hypothetical protein